MAGERTVFRVRLAGRRLDVVVDEGMAPLNPMRICIAASSEANFKSRWANPASKGWVQLDGSICCCSGEEEEHRLEVSELAIKRDGAEVRCCCGCN